MWMKIMGNESVRWRTRCLCHVIIKAGTGWAKVPDSSQDQFVLAALAAKANSPVSRLLHTTISMTASLEVE